MNSDKERGQKLASCYHEAGHAIACRELGGRVSKVSSQDGITEYYDIPQGSAEDAIVSWAGKIAQEIFNDEEHARNWKAYLRGEINSPYRYQSLPDVSPSDSNAIRAYTHQFHGYHRTQAGQEIHKAARDLLRDNWHDVIKVASALRDRRSLTGQEIESILRGDSMLTDKAKPEPVTSGSRVAESRSLTPEDRSRLKNNVEAITKMLSKDPPEPMRRELQDALERNKAQLAGRSYAGTVRAYRAFSATGELMSEETIPEKRG